ncbi:uncharacterized protein BJ212DRAFT_1508039 [Suillus subaureus]|uniref:Uncharacterized protein n=1 Tax=Suillus subaureus TaxID=48587 RepID=A0A9P7E9M5_9AGAM|nr:uncharacterized protein BJ212DRAFT_1508039 [Suillus subaureus]KAG1815250.1 hypothetical protein BJ212DRAFT_1508039 [Suillus subaureus]
MAPSSPYVQAANMGCCGAVPVSYLIFALVATAKGSTIGDIPQKPVDILARVGIREWCTVDIDWTCTKGHFNTTWKSPMKVTKGQHWGNHVKAKCKSRISKSVFFYVAVDIEVEVEMKFLMSRREALRDGDNEAWNIYWMQITVIDASRDRNFSDDKEAKRSSWSFQMDGQRAPKEAIKADLANDGALVIKPSLIGVMVDPKRMRNNGKKHARLSNQRKL